MNKTKMIIISGLPCTGKTTIGRKLSLKYNLPFISKDDVKESLFDSLGWKDREWSRKLGLATYPILYYFIEAQLKAGRSFIIESNFDPRFDNDNFMKLKESYKFDSLVIQCRTEGKILLDRFIKRSNSGQRHEGHRDHLNTDEFRDKLLAGDLEVLDVGGEVINLDTTDIQNISMDNIWSCLDRLLRNNSKTDKHG